MTTRQIQPGEPGYVPPWLQLPNVMRAPQGPGMPADPGPDPAAQYTGAIDPIAKAYQADPRTQLAQVMLQNGTSSAPVAGGDWAVADGLSRVVQALAGGVINKNQQRKYAKQEGKYTGALKEATDTALAKQTYTPPAAYNPQPPAMPTTPPGAPSPQAAAQALAGPAPAAPLEQAFDAALPGRGPAPQRAQGLALPPQPGQPATALRGPAAPPQQGVPSAAQLYARGIVPIEGGTDPKTRRFRTSPKGAVGPGQVMPGTAPEAARLAGLPWDERKYRTDYDYNYKLGEAYYAKQLERFGGNAEKAAVAYNGGPGMVLRAERRAARNGGSWDQHISAAESRQYLANFRDKVGAGATGVAAGGEPNGSVDVAMPTMESLPGMPDAVNTPLPDAPEYTTPVQSARLNMAQQLMASGNPYLTMMAQNYLDKGLTERNEAERRTQELNAARNETVYNRVSEESGRMRGDARQHGYQSQRDALQRNFQRETGYEDRRFQAGMQEDQQRFTANESSLDRASRVGESAADRASRERQAQLDRDSAEKIAGLRAGGSANRNAFIQSATGLKMQGEILNNTNAANEGIIKARRVLQIAPDVSFGGVYSLPGGDTLARIRAGFDDKGGIGEVIATSRQMVLDMAGGSLGAQISNSDRDFLQDQAPNIATSRAAAERIANMYIAAQQRKIEYNVGLYDAMAEGNGAAFNAAWSAYIQNNPMYRVGPGNKPVAVQNPITFKEWQSRERYDAQGRKIN